MSIIRLSNGTTVQIRTGVLQGIGPQGARGPVGPAGPDGPQGLKGDTGAIGQIIQVQSRMEVSSNTSVTANTDTLVGFGSVSYDDLAAATSSVLFTTTEAGDYLFTGYVGLSASATFDLWLYSTTNTKTIARSTFTGAYGQIVHGYRCAANEQFRVYIRATGSATVNSGALSITRNGSGPRGVQGIQGVQGEVGPQGPAGAQGPAGTAGGAYPTYGDLH